MTDTELTKQAKKIIADGCNCPHDCKVTGYCGCEDQARQIIALVRENDNPLS